MPAKQFTSKKKQRPIKHWDDGEFGFEPLSDEERARLDNGLAFKESEEEWFTNWLKRLLWAAQTRGPLAQVLCEQVALFARGKPHLAALMKERLKLKSRPEAWPLWREHMLLMLYLSYMREANGDHDRVLAKLVEYERLSWGYIPSPRTLDNRISKVINSGKLPDWLSKPDLLVVGARQHRGKKAKPK